MIINASAVLSTGLPHVSWRSEAQGCKARLLVSFADLQGKVQVRKAVWLQLAPCRAQILKVIDWHQDGAAMYLSKATEPEDPQKL